jgi:hypothetical protein
MPPFTYVDFYAFAAASGVSEYLYLANPDPTVPQPPGAEQLAPAGELFSRALWAAPIPMPLTPATFEAGLLALNTHSSTVAGPESEGDTDDERSTQFTAQGVLTPAWFNGPSNPGISPQTVQLGDAQWLLLVNARWPGSNVSLADHLFPQAPTAAAAPAPPALPAAGAQASPAAAPATPPVPPNALALHGGRFQVSFTYLHRATVNGQSEQSSGAGTPVELPETNGGSGYFYFFDKTKVDVVVGIVQAPAGWWVFAGGLTNVGCTLLVRDMKTGASKAYIAPDNIPFQPVQDTTTFNVA